VLTLLVEGGRKGCPGHALFSCLQHHAFLAADQATCQLSNASLQWNTIIVVVNVVVVAAAAAVGAGDDVEQPLLSCGQHHVFFSGDQAACQLTSATLQSKGVDAVGALGAVVVGGLGQPLPPCWQHQARLLTDHLFAKLWWLSVESAAQSKRKEEVECGGAVCSAGTCTKVSKETAKTLPSCRRYPPMTGAIVQF